MIQQESLGEKAKSKRVSYVKMDGILTNIDQLHVDMAVGILCQTQTILVILTQPALTEHT